MKNVNQKKRTKFKIGVLIAIILFLFLTGYSIGKEASIEKIEAKGEIAKPIFIVDNNPEIEITAMQNKGKYYFKVRNYEDDENISQVDLKYDIEILGEVDEAIQFNLYRGEEKISMQNNKTGEQILTKEEKQEQEYCLEIVYHQKNSISLSDIMQEIQVKVHAEQLRQKEG